jgi:hypothetical protein
MNAVSTILNDKYEIKHYFVKEVVDYVLLSEAGSFVNVFCYF